MDGANKNKLRAVEFRPRDQRPLYQQLAEGISEQIQDGQLPAGSRLPPLRELARVHRVALVTASQAYEVLAAEGLIESRRGRGTFVSQSRDGFADPLRSRAVRALQPGAPPYPAALDTRRAAALQAVRSAMRPGTIVLSTGNTAPETYPLADFARNFASTFLDDPPHIHQYRADRGDADLRALFAERLRKRGADVSADDILIVSGAQQALSLVADALVQPGDAGVAEAPTYFSALEVFDQKRVSWTNARVDADGVMTGAFRDAVRQAMPRFAYLNTAAQNPTGSYLSRSRHRDILAIARRANMTIVEDQSFWPVCFDGDIPPPLFASDTDGRVVLMESMSKLLMPSLRIGYIAAKGDALKALAASKLRADAFTTTVAQRALLRFLSSKAAARHLRATRFLYARRRDALVGAMRRALPADSRLWTPRGGVNVWIELPKGWSSLELLSYAASEGVVFLSGEPFYPTHAESNTLRMSYGNLPEELAREASARFGRAVRAYAAARAKAKRAPAADEAAITAAV